MSNDFYFYANISHEYLKREEKESGRRVYDWIMEYCCRNKVPYWDIEIWRGDEPYLRLAFKSQKQLDCFVRKGNDKYPYFEFR